MEVEIDAHSNQIFKTITETKQLDLKKKKEKQNLKIKVGDAAFNNNAPKLWNKLKETAQ